MKKSELRQIIKEEIKSILREKIEKIPSYFKDEIDILKLSRNSKYKNLKFIDKNGNKYTWIDKEPYGMNFLDKNQNQVTLDIGDLVSYEYEEDRSGYRGGSTKPSKGYLGGEWTGD